jgi:DNA repair exonuclease SbcCD ATPase subunit
MTTGMKPQQKDATQGEIEKLTGFTWQTMVNSVYIDQDIARAFLQGTKGERTKVLSRFQNLERFENALKMVRADKTKSDERLQKARIRLSVLDERSKGLEKRLSILVEESEQRSKDLWAEVVKRKKEWKNKQQDIGAKLTRMNELAKEWEKRVERLRTVSLAADKRLAQLEEKQRLRKVELVKLLNAMAYLHCPVCHQAVNRDSLKRMAKELESKLENILSHIKQNRLHAVASRNKFFLAEAGYDEVNMKRNRLESGLKSCKLIYDDAYSRYVEMKGRAHDETEAYRRTKTELKDAMKQARELRDVVEQLDKEKDFYAYCEKAMSRDGIPAFLNALMCPAMNAAAEYYSELFCDKALQVRFEIENGDFVPKIMNATGGEDISDQSDGEKAVAGNIASFALRDVAPKCNLLVLDEPGAGLDPDSARQFARALRQLTGKFDSIFVITHNVHISQELGEENRLLVVKERGVSRLVN